MKVEITLNLTTRAKPLRSAVDDSTRYRVLAIDSTLMLRDTKTGKTLKEYPMAEYNAAALDARRLNTLKAVSYK